VWAEAAIISGKVKAPAGAGTPPERGPRALRRVVSAPSLARFKICGGCGCTKPISPSFFRRRSGSVSGYVSRCKGCDRAYARINRARIAEQQRGYRQENRERKAAYDRARREADPDYNVRKCREYSAREGVAERTRQRVSEWQRNNPDKVRARNVRRRARKRKAEHVPYSGDDLRALYASQGGVCAYCPVPLVGGYHVDHIVPLDRGGADRLDNLALACAPCNLSKGNKTRDEFLQWREAG
jgi:5-methylcytosine-specific restriction endonuclease McrA